MLGFIAQKIFVPDENGELSFLSSAATDSLVKDPIDMGLAFTKLFGTFCAFLILIILIYWILRKLTQQRLYRASYQQSIQVIEKRALSPKTALYLIEVEGKKILVAESQLEIKRLEGFMPLDDKIDEIFPTIEQKD